MSQFSLINHFLVATPEFADSDLANCVVFVCDHTKEGAFGLVVNRPTDMTVSKLFQSVSLELARPDIADNLVFQGGPSQTERGFVLHEAWIGGNPDEAIFERTVTIPGGLELTTSKDVLEAIAVGGGPKRVMIFVGNKVWGAGELESELAENRWLVTEGTHDLIFSISASARYSAAIETLGIDLAALSPRSGSA